MDGTRGAREGLRHGRRLQRRLPLAHDGLLDRYGGLGAYGREDQISHRFVTEEFRQLQRSAEIFPVIFISVSAFLLNVVISRIVSIQRDQIATLKAFGYGNADITIHYLNMVVVIAIAG